MAFTLATARSYQSAASVIKGLQLQLPMIVYNGAAMVDPHDGHCLYKKVFAQKDAELLRNMLFDYHMYPFVYAWIDGAERVSYIDAYLHEGGRHYLSKRKGDPRFRKVDQLASLFEGDVFYITCIHELETLKPIYDILKLYNVSIVFQQELYRDEYWLEIMPEGTSKAAAIKELKEMEQADHLVSFGDARNDIEMFVSSDECYAVDNAVSELKDIADGVIACNDDSGVVSWLYQHVGKE